MVKWTERIRIREILAKGLVYCLSSELNQLWVYPELQSLARSSIMTDDIRAAKWRKDSLIDTYPRFTRDARAFIETLVYHRIFITRFAIISVLAFVYSGEM